MKKMTESDRSLATTPNVDILSQTQYRVYDCLLAAGLCLCFLIGLPGNCLSLTYFIRSKKRNLPTLLYITASSIDIVSCVIHLPVTANLLNRRKPGLLGEEIFCKIWYFTFATVQQMSMFVVMILSVTRAIVILFPFYKIKKATVLVVISIALFYIIFCNTTVVFDGEFYYSRGFSYCAFAFKQNLIQVLYSTHYSLLTGILPFLVFIATFAAILKLQTQLQSDQSPNNRGRHDASITMVCFALVFLVCNFLTFLNTALLTYSDFSDENYVHFYSSTFMFFYSWQISDIFCVVVNATINPVLYMFRFKEMQEWLISAFR